MIDGHLRTSATLLLVYVFRTLDFWLTDLVAHKDYTHAPYEFYICTTPLSAILVAYITEISTKHYILTLHQYIIHIILSINTD